MSIYVYRDGQQFGPYTEEQARQYLAAGNLRPDDWAWCERLADWVPLSQLLAGSQPQPVPAQIITPQGKEKMIWNIIDTVNLYHTGIGVCDWRIHLCDEGILAIPEGVAKTLKLAGAFGAAAGVHGGLERELNKPDNKTLEHYLVPHRHSDIQDHRLA